VRPSDAPIELTLDLRGTPPDKVLARMLGALERVSNDVTLYVLLRDTPEYIGVTASLYQALRTRGYFSDSARMPQGGQRLRIQRRREPQRPVFQEAEEDTTYAPPPDATAIEPQSPPPAAPVITSPTILPGEHLSGWQRSANGTAADNGAHFAPASEASPSSVEGER
jgi:hypothetical protein